MVVEVKRKAREVEKDDETRKARRGDSAAKTTKGRKRKRNEGAADNGNDDREKKDEREDDPAAAGEDAQKEFVPAKMVPSKTERDVDESDEVAQRSMYCGGIPFHKTEEDIRAAFDEEGLDVDSVDCMVFADSPFSWHRYNHFSQRRRSRRSFKIRRRRLGRICNGL